LEGKQKEEGREQKEGGKEVGKKEKCIHGLKISRFIK
jgi:hypothetical protein